jgi:hypothetical protein
MKITVRQIGPIPSLELREPVQDFVACERVFAAAGALLASGAPALIFDLRKVGELSYRGLNTLTRICEVADARGIPFAICGPNSAIAPLAYARILLTTISAGAIEEALAAALAPDPLRAAA